ncbi:hypothetical protein N7495_006763 [Penicillium taxi]|uniref:uncharacterized protein n=1 Tax=Penicillium taxi TaxID=168475 RepID=UPI002544F774|nr:uncharacterized protein N7495_006763 [Penicillium taxi]KAJ5895072.1 hypothetical protein N7495_006763 [Penicillium taxi]
MTLSNSAIIVIVLVCCLAVIAVCAALFKHYQPPEETTVSAYNASVEQDKYMRTVRERNYGHLKHASMSGQDVEARYSQAELNGGYPYGHNNPSQQFSQYESYYGPETPSAYVETPYVETPYVETPYVETPYLEHEVNYSEKQPHVVGKEAHATQESELPVPSVPAATANTTH